MNLPISIRGARQHNLQNLNLDLPSGKLIAFSGPSGSGKSSWRSTRFCRIPQTLSGLPVRQGQTGNRTAGQAGRGQYHGTSPALSLEQSARHQHPRTLLGSITEILDYLRILYAAAGRPHTRRRERNWSGKPRTRLRTPWPPSPNKRAWY